MAYYPPPASAGANTALSNLAAVAINLSLISDTDSTDDLGSSTKYWAKTYTKTLYINADGYFDFTNFFIQAHTYYWKFIRPGGTTDWFEIDMGTDDITFHTDNSYFQITKTFQPQVDSSSNLGSSTKYWLNTYTDKLFLNATATLDGATAGEVNVTGTLKFGTHTAIGAETVTGYITIKDSAGNSRKLAVVS